MSVIILLQIVNAFLLIGLIVVTIRAQHQIAESLSIYAGEELPSSLDEDIVDTDVHAPSDYERHVLLREANFDSRIEQMKRELSENAEARGHEAETLHPDVENLPHNSIREPNPPNLEYSV